MVSARPKLVPSAAEVARRLRKCYGRPGPPKPQGLVGTLVLTVLSQNTTSRNARLAFQRLRERFPRWEDVAAGPEPEIESTIRPAGLARQRARTIKRLLALLLAEDPSLELSQLRRLPTPQLMDWLQQLPGVGPKTAACVALFELGRPVFPVDTHVARISRRLGWCPAAAPPESIQRALEPAVPPRLRFELHVNLIAHGRLICRPSRPSCDRCILAVLCPSAGRVP
ncbi:MAG: endonuclease III [Armatimonadetes bacterium]|nr:endonuclease III [Armatimonadota bacterium]